jgi:hypothetical protein
MKRTSIRADTLIALLALATIALLTPVQVMPQMGSGPSRAMRGPLYNPATETTAKGMVKEVQQLSGKGVRGLLERCGALVREAGPATSYLDDQSGKVDRACRAGGLPGGQKLQYH